MMQSAPQEVAEMPSASDETPTTTGDSKLSEKRKVRKSSTKSMSSKDSSYLQSGSSKDIPSASSNNVLLITVTEPEKTSTYERGIADPVFQVTTCTQLGQPSSNDFIVIRQYSDFVSLGKCLRAIYGGSGPSAQVGLKKTPPLKPPGMGDPSLVTAASLEKYLCGLARHPVLHASKELRSFLDGKLRSSSTKGSSARDARSSRWQSACPEEDGARVGTKVEAAAAERAVTGAHTRLSPAPSHEEPALGDPTQVSAASLEKYLRHQARHSTSRSRKFANGKEPTPSKGHPSEDYALRDHAGSRGDRTDAAAGAVRAGAAAETPLSSLSWSKEHPSNATATPALVSPDSRRATEVPATSADRGACAEREHLRGSLSPRKAEGGGSGSVLTGPAAASSSEARHRLGSSGVCEIEDRLPPELQLQARGSPRSPGEFGGPGNGTSSASEGSLGGQGGAGGGAGGSLDNLRAMVLTGAAANGTVFFNRRPTAEEIRLAEEESHMERRQIVAKLKATCESLGKEAARAGKRELRGLEHAVGGLDLVSDRNESERARTSGVRSSLESLIHNMHGRGTIAAYASSSTDKSPSESPAVSTSATTALSEGTLVQGQSGDCSLSSHVVSWSAATDRGPSCRLGGQAQMTRQDPTHKSMQLGKTQHRREKDKDKEREKEKWTAWIANTAGEKGKSLFHKVFKT